MLDLDPQSVVHGAALPRGWHFFLLAGDTRRSLLRADGFPGLGVSIPDLGLPRLMLGGRTVTFHKDIPIGASLLRDSAVLNIDHKIRESGDLAVVTIAHALRLTADDGPAIVETQTYLLLPARTEKASATPLPRAETRLPRCQKIVIPDETLLFQFSALGFNSHRIHLDRDHARNVEGFPDLVVNGGFSTLMLTEFLRQEVALVPSSYSVKHLAPLYCNRPVTLTAEASDGGWRLKAFDDQQVLAVDMKVEIL